MSEAEVISLFGEPTSEAMSDDDPNLIWCYGTDTWTHWDAGDNYCGMTSLRMSPDGHVVRPAHSPKNRKSG
jgi:hypothetical protein